jgi:hypothetical protein
MPARGAGACRYPARESVGARRGRVSAPDANVRRVKGAGLGFQAS